jgi:hypothetical protein
MPDNIDALVQGQYSLVSGGRDGKRCIVKIFHDLTPFCERRGFQKKSTRDGEGFGSDITFDDNVMRIVKSTRDNGPSMSHIRDVFWLRVSQGNVRPWMEDFPVTRLCHPEKITLSLNEIAGSITVNLPPRLLPNSFTTLQSTVNELEIIRTEILTLEEAFKAQLDILKTRETSAVIKIQRVASQLEFQERNVVELRSLTSSVGS